MNPLTKSKVCLKWATCSAVPRKNENDLPKKVFSCRSITKICLRIEVL
jgi:hypothetical protein